MTTTQGMLSRTLRASQKGPHQGVRNSTVELDRAKGEGKAASGEAGPFGPAVDEVEEVRKAFVGLPEDPGAAGDVEPGLELDGVQGDGRVGGHVGDPVPTPGIARQHDFIVAVPVVGGLYGAETS